MDNYIDREELLKNMAEKIRQFDCGYQSVFELIQNAPSVDAVEQKHGRWIVRTDFGNGCREIRCSECGETGFWRNQPLYCPYCGAKMDEVTE